MNDQLDALRDTLAADGYGLEVEARERGFLVKVSSADGVCDDCLVPKPLLVSMLQPALGVAADGIELLYPDEL
ncbi:hypothetical protein MUN78_00430 [Leucobacter allii]|uniref:NifU family protein n=1 Tax=Leucobacter allii TaxID=2932247 RepID=A0ABY4FM48_9MICO|nr:hypothetical protein [Leucobacter allii]UOQ57344.1 hypothetical protein MUN78_00430 [Leucobacter allii]